MLHEIKVFEYNKGSQATYNWSILQVMAEEIFAEDTSSPITFQFKFSNKSFIDRRKSQPRQAIPPSSRTVYDTLN